MSKDARINFVVEKERREEWKEYASESEELTGLSHLIRRAVIKEVEDTSTSLQTGDGSSVDLEWLEDQLSELNYQQSELAQLLDSTMNRVDQVAEDVSMLKDSVDTGGPDVDMEKTLLQVLPTPEQLPEDVSGYEGQEVARRLGAPLPEVADRLDDLARDHPGVHRIDAVESDGHVEAVYWKEGR